MPAYLDFEKPLAELEGKIQELRALAEGDASVKIKGEARRLETRAAALLRKLYKELDPWQKCQVARHPERPHMLDYVESLFDEFSPLAGDRAYADDQAILGGLARFRGAPVMVIGHEKGADTQSRVKHNFGMARPEGYRKAVRLMTLADRFRLPVISLIDTAGAYPGIGAEQRGQSEAIARSTDRCLSLKVPNLALVIGEGGSGGAVALATANRVLMLEHAIYTVASPEASASILWRDAARARDAAGAMRITAQSLIRLGVIDEIISEPLGGAHRNPAEAIAAAGQALARHLRELQDETPEQLQTARSEKFLAMGRAPAAAPAAIHARRRTSSRAKPRRRS